MRKTDSDYCLFCEPENTQEHKIIAENDKAFARWDNFPVTTGHLEVVPKRHVVSFFGITADELHALHGLLNVAKDTVDDMYAPDAYNIGINDGVAAGRTVHHLHVHLIPRYEGDVDDPSGGFRNMLS